MQCMLIILYSKHVVRFKCVHLYAFKCLRDTEKAYASIVLCVFKEVKVWFTECESYNEF